MKGSILDYRRKLTLLWLLTCGVVFFVLIAQTILGKYRDASGDAWSWFLSNVLPTLSLMMGVMVGDAIDKSDDDLQGDRFLFRLSYSLSAIYLLSVSLSIFMQPFSKFTALELMMLSNLWLKPLQPLVFASCGIFFVKKGKRQSLNQQNSAN